MRFLVVLVAIICFFVPSQAYPGGPVHGAKGSAMGTAFVAVADDLSALAYNPAGLTQRRGTNIYGGTTFVIPSTSYKGPSGGEEETDFQIFFPPHLYAASDFGTRDFRFGLGVFSPFGIGGRKWDEKGLTRYLSTGDMFATLWINPTVAYQISPALSVGAGLEYMLSRHTAKRMINQAALGHSDGEMELKAFGDGWGYNLGLLLTPHEKVSVGLAYRSRIKVKHAGDMRLQNIAPALQPLFGGSEFITDVSAPATFPDILSLGVAYRPEKELTLSFDLEQVRWSSFKTAELNLDNEVPQAGITSASAPLDWKDVWTVKFGAEYMLTEKLAIRGGYAYVPTPVPSHTIEPGNPDATQHNFSLGAGYKKDKLTFDFFYMAGFYQNRTTENAILTGRYENFVHYTGISLGYGF
ncbi:MAG: outer membrane protein transport protein [Nitrospirae bacterium]|nr:outer membrane protein transport protein [Nitrospirota bacterium]